MPTDEAPRPGRRYAGPLVAAGSKQEFGDCLWRERVGLEFARGTAQHEKRKLPQGNSKVWYWEQGHRLPQNESALRAHLNYLRVEPAKVGLWISTWERLDAAEKAARRSASTPDADPDAASGPVPTEPGKPEATPTPDVPTARGPYEKHQDAFLRHLVAAAEFIDVQRNIDRGKIDTPRLPDFTERKQRYERSVMEIYLLAGPDLGPLVADAQEAIIHPPGLTGRRTSEQVTAWVNESHLRLARVREAMFKLLATDPPPG